MVEPLPRPPSDADVEGLAALLLDAVDSGAAVSFLDTLTRAGAEAWWRATLLDAEPRAVFLVARDEDGIAGTVQLRPARAPNQPHRAEVLKLMVHRRARGAGLGERLMREVEQAARREGFALLTLDAKRGGPADRLYRRLGWTEAGTIPDFAVDPDGETFHDAVIFWKRLA